MNGPEQKGLASPRLCAVTAELLSPAVFDTWWPAPLDGLLAAAAESETDELGRHTSLRRLPLVRWKRGLNKQWVWAASSVVLAPPVRRDAPERLVAPGPLRWIAAGDPDRLAQALSRVHQVGAERSAGQGRVGSWDVDDLGECDPSDPTIVVWRSDGYLSRPLPVRAATALGLRLATVDTVEAAIRPPYSTPPKDASGARRWRPVLAPWTTRPVGDGAG